MRIMYPLSMKEYFESTYETLYHLKFIGISFYELSQLLDCPEDDVKSWVLRGIEGFQPSLSFAGENDNLFLLILIFTFGGLWEVLEEKAYNELLNNQDELETESYWKEFRRVIVTELGGISPYKISPFSGGYRQSEFSFIPKTFIRKNGIKIDRIVEELQLYFPQYGVTDENSLYTIFERYLKFRLRKKYK